MQLNPQASPNRPGAGFSLIEVLVTLAILAVGLLGLVSLMLRGLQDTRVALQHTIATALVADIAEHIRANRPAAGGYALPAGATLDSPAATCTRPGECSPVQLAALDLYRWQRAARVALPEAETSIVVTADATGVQTCTITLHWRQSGDTTPATAAVTVQV